MAIERATLFGWLKKKGLVVNLLAFTAGGCIVVLFSPIIIAYLLYVKFGVPTRLEN